MQPIKKCSMCKKTKNLLEFWFRKDQNDYRANCKECCSKLRKKYYKKNKKTLLIWHKQYRLENRDKIIKQQKKYYYEKDGAKQRRIWRSKNLLRERKTAKKYRLNNINNEVEKKRLKDYYEKNKEDILKKNAQIITCECGCEVRLNGLSRHKKTELAQFF